MSRRQSDDRNTGEEFVFSGTNEQFGRPLCVPWVIVLSNVPRSETFERNAIVLVESSFFCFFFMPVVVVFCGFCVALWNGSVRALAHARAHPRVRAQTRMYAPFFSISLSADSNESSVHLSLFCAEMLRLKSFSADWGAIHVQNSSYLSRQRRAAEFMEICVDLKYLTVMSVYG